jgi:SSS family solute:Na+ symporter
VTTTLVVTFLGIALIAAVGFLGRRGAITDVSDWAVGGRSFGALTMWFLQAGEVFTTFTFLAMAGLAFAGGAAALYALPYIPLAYVGLYFLGPMLWRRARERGHVTQADFLADHFGSRGFGVVVAILGVVFLLPYLQLQITGLGLAVQLATGQKASGTVSMVVAFVLTVAFVLWAGIRGVASTSYLKDALMLVVLIVLVAVVPAAVNGGIGPTFERILADAPRMLTIHAGQYDAGYFISSTVASTLGVLFMTLPHSWPALLSAGSERAVRRNYAYLPIYSVCLLLPMIIGFVAFTALPPGTSSNGALLTIAGQVFPSWFVGVVVVATAATAMVPAAGLIIGMSSLVARNVVATTSPQRQTLVNQVSVVGLTGLALVLAIVRPDLLANLLLLTYSGLDQLVPALVLALFALRWAGLRPVLAGLVVGEVVVIALTFGPYSGTVNEGLIALVPNIAVVVAGALIERRRAGGAPTRTAEPTPVPARGAPSGATGSRGLNASRGSA